MKLFYQKIQQLLPSKAMYCSFELQQLHVNLHCGVYHNIFKLVFFRSVNAVDMFSMELFCRHHKFKSNTEWTNSA